MSFFSLFYYLLSLVIYTISLPFLVYLQRKSKYKEAVPLRFFPFKNRRFKNKGIWFHACSLGEVAALKPLVDALKTETVNLTTITNTGFAKAKSLGVSEYRYLPYELFMPMWTTKQKVLIVLEAEFWYMMVLSAKLKGSKVVFLNARINDRSYKKYLRFAWFYKKIFAHVDLVLAQSPTDVVRFGELGAKNVQAIGNIKLAQEIRSTKVLSKPNQTLHVAASTHEGEEELILKAFTQYKKGVLALVPRHPERFEEVCSFAQNFAKEQGFSFARYSQSQNFENDITVVDVMGELINIYAISDVVILGGGFNPKGGHNPLEPATFNNKIISGDKIFNQLELFKYITHTQIIDENSLYDALVKSEKLPVSRITEGFDMQNLVATLKKYL